MKTDGRSELGSGFLHFLLPLVSTRGAQKFGLSTLRNFLSSLILDQPVSCSIECPFQQFNDTLPALCPPLHESVWPEAVDEFDDLALSHIMPRSPPDGSTGHCFDLAWVAWVRGPSAEQRYDTTKGYYKTRSTTHNVGSYD